MGKNVKRVKIKETVLDLLEVTPGDELTVQQVAEEAHISKQTLYNNYYGLVGAIEDTLNDIMSKAAAEYAGPYNWYYQTRALAEMMAERKNVFIHLYYSKYRDELLHVISSRAEPYMYKYMRYCEEKAGVRLNDNDRQVLIDFYMDVYMGGVSRYLSRKLEDDPDHLMSIYGVVLRGLSKAAILKLNQLTN